MCDFAPVGLVSSRTGHTSNAYAAERFPAGSSAGTGAGAGLEGKFGSWWDVG